MSGNIDERVRDEIEALEAILMDDLKIDCDERGAPERITTVVFPSTAADAGQQYVCVTLEVTIVPGYPDKEPEIRLRNPRGLDDSLLDEMNRAVKEKCIEFIGQAVVFELIELIRERLTESNLPSCRCAVCLCGFQPGDQFIKTQCYHYFHSHCLACHLTSAQRQHDEEQERLPTWQRQQQEAAAAIFVPQCPVCREAITCDLESLRRAPPPLELKDIKKFEITAELRALQAKMAALFLYQQSRGGIIDLDAEQTKMLVLTNSEEDQQDTSPPTERVQQNINNNNTEAGPSARGRHHSGRHRGRGRGKGCRHSATGR